jgi:hypothetical protein
MFAVDTGGVEIIAGRALDLAVAKGNDGVDGLAAGTVVFADGDEAIPVENHISEAQAGGVGERGRVPVDLLIIVICKIYIASGYQKRAAAVLVNARASIETSRSNVFAIFYDDVAAGFAGTTFNPVPLTVKCDLRDR